MLNGLRTRPSLRRISAQVDKINERIGLVLGGGGAVGAAYHAGALAALEHDLGWDPRRADFIVGTSAGALVGALLRLGLPSSDLAAVAVGAPVRQANRALVQRLVNRPAVPPLTVRSRLRRPRRLNPRSSPVSPSSGAAEESPQSLRSPCSCPKATRP